MWEACLPRSPYSNQNTSEQIISTNTIDKTRDADYSAKS
jgi:hypothetical protein